jgi:hypothetical protein
MNGEVSEKEEWENIGEGRIEGEDRKVKTFEWRRHQKESRWKW